MKCLSNEIKGRYDAFWRHEDADRPILSITVPDKTAQWEDHKPKTLHDQWENLEARYSWSRFAMEHTRYFGEAMPQDWANFGPGCMAAMLGSDYILTDFTIWFGERGRVLKDWGDLDSLHLHEDSPMYGMVLGMTALLAGRSGGRYVTGISDLGGNLDILASLRDTQDLLTDIYENPEIIIRAVERIDEMWIDYFKRLRGIIRASGQDGHGTWLGLWCETNYYPLQCDFSAMISPDDFKRFAMPSLRRISDFLGHSIFHMDGPNQIVHLDHLLSLPRLDGIQWVAGSGKAPVWDEKWYPLYEKIQSAGKSLVLHEMGSIENTLKICKNFSPKGLWMSVTLDTEEEAAELLAKAAELSKPMT